MRLLALDFDGVLSNSAPEAFVVALRCYASIHPASRFAASAERFGAETAPTPEAVAAHELFAPFLELMPLGNRAEDYAVVLEALERERAPSDQAEFDGFRAELDSRWLRAYHERFYRVRAVLSKGDPAGWLRLMSPYPSFVDVLRRRAGDVVLCVATAKDRGSVRKLLRAYGIDDLFADDRVLDKEAGERKSAHLAVLRDRFGIPYADMTFVDDKVNHLQDVGALGVRCVLATWGFNGPREVATARSAGHLACSLADVEEQLFR